VSNPALISDNIDIAACNGISAYLHIATPPKDRATAMHEFDDDWSCSSGDMLAKT